MFICFITVSIGSERPHWDSGQDIYANYSSYSPNNKETKRSLTCFQESFNIDVSHYCNLKFMDIRINLCTFGLEMCLCMLEYLDK